MPKLPYVLRTHTLSTLHLTTQSNQKQKNKNGGVGSKTYSCRNGGCIPVLAVVRQRGAVALRADCVRVCDVLAYVYTCLCVSVRECARRCEREYILCAYHRCACVV